MILKVMGAVLSRLMKDDLAEAAGGHKYEADVNHAVAIKKLTAG